MSSWGRARPAVDHVRQRWFRRGDGDTRLPQLATSHRPQRAALGQGPSLHDDWQPRLLVRPAVGRQALAAWTAVATTSGACPRAARSLS